MPSSTCCSCHKELRWSLLSLGGIYNCPAIGKPHPSRKVLQRTGTLHRDTGECTQRERERERVHAQLWQDCSQPVGNWTSHMIELLRFWSFLFIHFFLRGKSSPFLFVRHVSIFLLKCQSPKNQSMEVLGSFKSSFSAMASHFHMVPCYWRSVRQPQPPICIYLHPFAHFWEDISTSHLHIPKQRVHTKGFLGLARFYGWAGYRLELNRLD